MSGHYEDERELWSKLQQTSQELAEIMTPVRVSRLISPDQKPRRPGKYRLRRKG